MIPRRQFLKSSAYTLGFLGLSRLTHAAPASRVADPYGPLLPDPNRLLDLPKGFKYSILSRTGDKMSDGLKVPGMHDGMAAFPGPDGTIILVRNHELGLAETNKGPLENNNRFPSHLDASLPYDPGDANTPPYLGGTTNVVYDPKSGKVLKEFLSLFGTDHNCAGGAMPWGTWITCEDLVNENQQLRPHLRGVTPAGEIFTIAKNALNRSEFAGSTLSPDGKILFVNIQAPGITLAITGPWRA